MRKKLFLVSILLSLIIFGGSLVSCVGEQSTSPPPIEPLPLPPSGPVVAGGDSTGYADRIAEEGATNVPIKGAVVVGIATDDEDADLSIEIGTDPSLSTDVSSMVVKVSQMEKTGTNEYRFTWPESLQYATTYFCRIKLTTKSGEGDWIITNFTTEAEPSPPPPTP